MLCWHVTDRLVLPWLAVLMIASCAEACHWGCVGQYYVRMPHVRKPRHYSTTIAAPCLWHADLGCVWLCGCGCVPMGLCVFVVATVVHSGELTISYVLQAMGVSREVAAGTVRLSVGRFTTTAEVKRVVAAVSKEVCQLLGEQPPAADGAEGGATAGAGSGAGAGAGGSVDWDSLPATGKSYFESTMWLSGVSKVLAAVPVAQLPEPWRRSGFDHAVITATTLFHPQARVALESRTACARLN